MVERVGYGGGCNNKHKKADYFVADFRSFEKGEKLSQ